jgi:uncharacterized protein
MQANSPVSPSSSQALKPFVFAFVLLASFMAVIYYGVQHNQTDPWTVAQIFSTRFLGIFIEAVPFLLMGSITSGLIEAFIRADDIVRWMPKNKYVATACGAFGGLLFPVCECGVVPVARRLFTKGLPASVGISFLLAAPFMNPIVFASTYIAFGFGTIFIGRFVVTAIVAITVGLVFAFTTRNEDALLPESMLDSTSLYQPRPTLLKGLAQALGVAVNEFFDIGRYLVIGCLLAASMQTIVPQETLLQIGSNNFTSVLVMQILAFILSVCSTVDSFLALAFVNTFTTGAIISFLSFGPMVDVKSTMMFLGVFKRRTVVYLIVLPFTLNLLAGVLINLMLGYR